MFKSLEEVQEDVDIALIATPAAIVPSVLEQCGKRHVKGAVVLAVGFGETGSDGIKLQQQITAIGKREGVRIVGPNTSGVFNLHHCMSYNFV